MKKLTDERIDEIWESLAYKAPVYLARAVESEVLRLNGITGDGRGEAVAYRYGTALLWPDEAPIGEPDCDPLYATPPQQEQAAPSHASDCATNNAPAYKPGPCDCQPTPEMCRAAVEFMNGADIYGKVPAGVTEIEEGIYREVWLAMQRKAPQQAAPGAVQDGLLKRAVDLHEKAGMPWAEAEQLALSEAGIEDGHIDELTGNTDHATICSLLSKEEVREFTRTVLIYGQPLLSAAPMAVTPDGWQDISTAPKDGYMLVHEDGAIRALLRIDGVWHKPGYPAIVDPGYGDALVGEDAKRMLPAGYRLELRDGCCDNPTHWMPLPAAPKQEPGA